MADDLLVALVLFDSLLGKGSEEAGSSVWGKKLLLDQELLEGFDLGVFGSSPQSLGETERGLARRRGLALSSPGWRGEGGNRELQDSGSREGASLDNELGRMGAGWVGVEDRPGDLGAVREGGSDGGIGWVATVSG